jgi:hypothetical protein
LQLHAELYKKLIASIFSKVASHFVLEEELGINIREYHITCFITNKLTNMLPFFSNSFNAWGALG